MSEVPCPHCRPGFSFSGPHTHDGIGGSGGTDLVAFLNARLAEDEARVKRGQPVPWTTEMTKRAYREVEAKRRILAMYVSFCETYREQAAIIREHGIGAIGPGVQTGRAVLRDAVSALAAVHSDHPDYDPAWMCD